MRPQWGSRPPALLCRAPPGCIVLKRRPLASASRPEPAGSPAPASPALFPHSAETSCPAAAGLGLGLSSRFPIPDRWPVHPLHQMNPTHLEGAQAPCALGPASINTLACHLATALEGEDQALFTGKEDAYVDARGGSLLLGGYRFLRRAHSQRGCFSCVGGEPSHE